MNPNEVVLINKSSYHNDLPETATLSEICRLCLQTVLKPEDSPLMSIHDEYYRMTIKSLVEMYTFLKLPDGQGDKLPLNVCGNCADFLIEMHTFRCTCYFNNDILLKLTKRANNEESESMILSESDPQIVVIEEYQNISHSEPELEPLGPFKSISMQASDEKLRIFRCKFCPMIFNERLLLLKHQCANKPPKNKKKAMKKMCPTCGKFYQRNALKTHLRLHTGEKPFACTLCNYRTSNEPNLHRHIKRHTGEKPYMCSICGHAFIQLNDLKLHESKHLKYAVDGPNPKMWRQSRRKGTIFRPLSSTVLINGKESQVRICIYCRRGFTNEASHHEHVQTNHKKEVNPNLKATRRNNEENGIIHSCMESDCNEAFASDFLLAQHVRQHNKSKPYTCNECNKKMSDRKCFIKHMCTHTGEKLYNCKMCNKAFTGACQLLQHERIHTGLKPYACHLCPKKFVQNSQLKYHMLTHTGEKPYKCEFCGHAFALNGNLTAHRRIHTGETPFKCCVCSKVFHNSNNRKKHQDSKHSQEEITLAMAQLNDDVEDDHNQEKQLYVNMK